MFRDSRGVVHTVSSADPLADLPAGAAKALQLALLDPTSTAVDIGSVLERCDAVRELLERWQDAFFASLSDDVDLIEEATWAAEAGMSLDEVEAGYSEQDDDDEFDLLDGDVAAEDLLSGDSQDDDIELDNLVELLEAEGGPDDPRTVLPDELVAVLERELLLLPLRVRLEALVAAVDLVTTWSELVADHEKLLGHLILAHAEPQVMTGQEELVGRHAALHAATGAAHA